MIRAVFFAGILLLGLVGLILCYRVVMTKIRTEKELQKRELEHEERKELFEDEDP